MKRIVGQLGRLKPEKIAEYEADIKQIFYSE